MTLNNFIRIFITIIFANYINSKINFFITDYYINFTLGFLVFSYWVYTLKEHLYALPSFCIGLSIDLISLERPSNEYQTCLYDMEASGFCAIAPMFSCNELVFVLKIVSDTPESPIGSIPKKTITQLISHNIEQLQKIIATIEKLVSDEKKRLKIPEEVFQYFDKYHFTQSNRYKFIQTYKKWKSAFPNRKLENTLATANSASKLISSLESELISAIKEWKL